MKPHTILKRGMSVYKSLNESRIGKSGEWEHWQLHVKYIYNSARVMQSANYIRFHIPTIRVGNRNIIGEIWTDSQYDKSNLSVRSY